MILLMSLNTWDVLILKSLEINVKQKMLHGFEIINQILPLFNVTWVIWLWNIYDRENFQ